MARKTSTPSTDEPRFPPNIEVREGGELCNPPLLLVAFWAVCSLILAYAVGNLQAKQRLAEAHLQAAADAVARANANEQRSRAILAELEAIHVKPCGRETALYAAQVPGL